MHEGKHSEKSATKMTCVYQKTPQKRCTGFSQISRYYFRDLRFLLFWTKIIHWDTKEYKRSSHNKSSTHAKIDYALTFGMPKKPKIFSLSFTKIE